MKNIEIGDILIFLGLILQGIGLFYFRGIGLSAAVVGTELLLLGTFGKK